MAGRLQQPSQIDVPNKSMSDKQTKSIQNSQPSGKFHKGMINYSLHARPKSKTKLGKMTCFGYVCLASETHWWLVNPFFEIHLFGIHVLFGVLFLFGISVFGILFFLGTNFAAAGQT